MRPVPTDTASCRRLHRVKAFPLPLVIVALLCAAPAARAGSYTGPNYSGGTWYGPGQDGTPGTNPDGPRGNGWGGGSGGSKSATCGGTITAAFTWKPADGQTLQSDPPPQSVVVLETTSTEASGASYPPGSVGGSCDDGFGHTQSMTQTGLYAYPGSNQQVGTAGKAALGGTRYSSQPGSAPAPSAGPTASASASSTASSDLTYTASVTAVTINPAGATPDGSGGYAILVGQGCSPVLNGIPGGTGWTVTYQWSVSGTTFQTWSATTPAFPSASPPTAANPNASYYDGGPGPLNGPAPNASPAVPAPHWYWNDPSQTKETISCTAMVTPPAGQGNTFSVTATQKVTVMVPSFDVNTAGGVGRINNYGKPSTIHPGLYLYAGSTTPGLPDGGEIWVGSVSTLTPFSGGQWRFLQIITPSRKNGSVSTDPNTGLIGLDSGFPYNATYNADGAVQADGDAPAEPLLDSYANMTIADAFHTYIMYQPPGTDVMWVPIADTNWNFSANDNRPVSGHWSDYTPADAAGTVTPASGKFVKQSAFPSWSRINH